MSSKILFTHSYFYKYDSKQWRFHQPYPPLGTITAAAFIRQQGFDVSLFDTNLKDDPKDILVILEETKPSYLVIYDDGFNYLSKMCLSNMREAALRMINLAKRYDCTVIVSSSDATDHAQTYLNAGANYVLNGEGEITLKMLLEQLESNSDQGQIEQIHGIIYSYDNDLIKTPQRSVLRDLDTLPIPAWDLIDIDSYRNIWIKHHGYFSLNIATTRGCPFKCNWCAKPIYGNRYNSRSPEHVIREIEMLVGQYHPEHFWICDDIFGLKPGWVQEFNKLLNDKNLNIQYKIQSRADLLLKEDTIDALVESGLNTVWIGAESGSQSILDSMDKGITIEQIKEATNLLKSKNVKVGFFLQFGYLGETLNDINATLNMMLQLMPDEIGISVSYPLPGTNFYENVKGMLKEKQNWTDSDDLAMMFKSTFSPRFYKILHRYIHNRYRIQRGINQLKSLNWKTSENRFFRNILSMLYNTPISWVHAYQLYKLGRTNVNH